MMQNEEAWYRFLELCSRIKSPERLKDFFDLFLTIEERETLAARLLVIEALLKGEMTQREIAETFGASISQITRGSNALKIITPELRIFLNKYFKD